MACGLLLLMGSQGNSALAHAVRARAAFVVSGMMLALLSEFAVAPKIVARENLALRHSVGTLMYALQWVRSALSLWRLMPTTHHGQV